MKNFAEGFIVFNCGLTLKIAGNDDFFVRLFNNLLEIL